MPIRDSQDLSAYNKRFFNLPPTINGSSSSTPDEWVRNPSWLALPSVGTNDQKFVGLFAVFPDASGGEASNFLAFTISGNYTVDWGDGTVENFNAAVTAQHIYDFNDADLANTNAPVTLTDTGDKVERTAHGYTNGMAVRFYNIVSTTGLTEGQIYYVINANANDFQVSTIVGGSAVALTTNGSATLLNYKQAVVTITPQGGANLTSINLNVKHNQTNLQAYDNGWLDIRLGSPNLSSLTVGSSLPNSSMKKIERVEFVNTGTVSSFASLCHNLNSLQKFIIGTIGNITSTINMFNNCYSLVSVPFFDTANVTSMGNMFTNCYSLVSVPIFNTSKNTSMSAMFSNCYNLTSIPLFNTINVTSTSQAFNGCSSLTSVPLFNMASVTTMTSMFASCFSLVSVPLFNTASVTNMSSMFSVCRSLVSVPLFNTASVTSMSNMFSNCSSLVSVPLFNTASVNDMSSMFNGCSSLVSVPLFNTASVTSMSSMFNGCLSLVSVPLFNTASVTSINSMFQNCQALVSVPLFNMANVTTTNSMFNACDSISSIPLFNTNTVTNMQAMFSSCNSLQSIPAYNFSTTTAGNLSNIFNNCPSISDISASGGRFTHSLQNLKLSKTALKKYMDNLAPIGTASQTLTISSNWGIGTTSNKTITSTAQSTTVTCTDTSSLSVGMMMSGVATGLNTGIDVVSDVTADTLTFNSHGLTSGTRVSFATSGITGGIALNTIYYPVNVNVNNFQIAATSGGSAINLTGTSGVMNLRYSNYITSINPNVSITLDTPAASGITNGTWTFRQVDAYGALLRGWTVTF